MNSFATHLIIVTLILGCYGFSTISTNKLSSSNSASIDDEDDRSHQFPSRLLITRDTSSQKNNQKRLACYYNNQGAMRTQKGLITADMIDPFLCTHLIYLSLGLDNKGQVKSLMPKVDFEANNGLDMLRKLSDLKKTNPQLKTMIAVEGNSEKYSPIASSPEMRSNFIRSVMDYLTRYNLDGLDIIWKHPNDARGKEEDKENFVKLLEELKRAFTPKGHVLSAAMPVGPNRIEAGIDVRGMSEQLDFMNLMSYDYNGGWDNETGLHAPLYQSNKYDRSDSERELNVAWSVRHYLKKGADPKKLMLGVTTYGRTFTLKNPNLNGINAPVKGSGKQGPYTKNDKLLGYNEICEAITIEPDKWRIVRDFEYKVPYAFKDDQWVSYEDTESVKLKAKYAIKQGLGGVTVTSLSMDDFLGDCKSSEAVTYPVTRAIKRELEGGKVLDVEVRSAASSFPGVRNSEESDELPKLPTSRPQSSTTSFPNAADTEAAPVEELIGFDEGSISPPSTRSPATITSSRPVINNIMSNNFGREELNPLPVCGTNNQWWFPGPSCRQYYDCTSGQAILKECRSGLVWKQSRLWCDYPQNVPECPLS